MSLLHDALKKVRDVLDKFPPDFDMEAHLKNHQNLKGDRKGAELEEYYKKCKEYAYLWKSIQKSLDHLSTIPEEQIDEDSYLGFKENFDQALVDSSSKDIYSLWRRLYSARLLLNALLAPFGPEKMSKINFQADDFNCFYIF